MNADLPKWTDQDSEEFINSGALFVPERDLQMDMMCRLLPAPQDGATVAFSL